MHVPARYDLENMQSEYKINLQNRFGTFKLCKSEPEKL